MRDIKIFADQIEEEASAQIELLLAQKAFEGSKIRIMPDVHKGVGCVIGFTADLKEKVIPNIVGVDIGCGMKTLFLGKIDVDFEALDAVIHEYIPSGYDVCKGRLLTFEALNELKCFRHLKDVGRLHRSIGTLGGGNHFIEIDQDEDNNKYLIIHTGSRNLGLQIANYYQNLADQLCNYDMHEYFLRKEEIIKTYKEDGRRKEIQEKLKEIQKEYSINKERIPKDLAYLEGLYREDYLHDMKIAQEFAIKNRQMIADIILEKMQWKALDSFETIHNYIEIETNIVRKGAISAKKGELVLIPMNMKDGCLLAKGKGNKDWNESAPHGAGRVLSRTKAKEVLKMEDYKKSMEGIYTTSISFDTLDESPMSYKKMEDIIAKISDTVEIIKVIKPIYNFKAK